MDKTEQITNIATKRGFFFPSAEIYGGKAGFWTYGHLGLLIKQRFENLWRDYFLSLSDNYFEIEDCNILPKDVFKSSGHLDNFNDPLTECASCHFRFRADQLIEDELKIRAEGLGNEDMDKLIKENKLKCPRCGSNLMPVKWFNMMFDVKVGVIGDDVMYLRPETAQAPYLAFKREFLALREKIPFGLAVIGKAFRNEISPRQAFFRLREFTQAELQIFFNPHDIDKADRWNEVKNYKLKISFVKDKGEKIIEISCEDLNKKLWIPKFYVYHLAKIQQFYLDILKIDKEKFRFRELSDKEKAFYNKVHFDIELFLETLGGFKEVAGLHYRTDHDLKGHQKGSKEKLEVNIGNKKIIPHVLELSFGIDRNVWALLDIFYKEEIVEGEKRSLFLFPSTLAPLDAAVFPLVSNDDNIVKNSKDIYNLLRSSKFKVVYDESGSIGRRYRRIDEVGIKYGITIDFDSLKQNDVTFRDRDSMKQIRVKINDLNKTLSELLCGTIRFENAGKLIK